MSESRLKSLCHEKDAQLRNRDSEINSLKAGCLGGEESTRGNDTSLEYEYHGMVEEQEDKEARIKVLISNVQSLKPS